MAGETQNLTFANPVTIKKAIQADAVASGLGRPGGRRSGREPGQCRRGCPGTGQGVHRIHGRPTANRGGPQEPDAQAAGGDPVPARRGRRRSGQVPDRPQDAGRGPGPGQIRFARWLVQPGGRLSAGGRHALEAVFFPLRRRVHGHGRHHPPSKTARNSSSATTSPWWTTRRPCGN